MILNLLSSLTHVIIPRFSQRHQRHQSILNRCQWVQSSLHKLVSCALSIKSSMHARLTLLWYPCEQILQFKYPIPSFLSNLTLTDFSWWQYRQVNVVSVCRIRSRRHVIDSWYEPKGSRLRVWVGLRLDFFRLPILMTQKTTKSWTRIVNVSGNSGHVTSSASECKYIYCIQVI